MIIVRAPVRISIGGGGTDVPSYYSRFGGEWVSAAINKYIYVAVNRRFDDTFRIGYSRTEEVAILDEIQHPIVREALRLLKIDGGIEIVSIADVPSHTGLGTSGSFSVALLTALHGYLQSVGVGELPSRKEIAEQACHIAINVLGEPSGKQDEYIASYGGLTAFSVSTGGVVTAEPLYPQVVPTATLADLESRLLLFYTGIRRSSSQALEVQRQATIQDDTAMIENLHRVKELGREIRTALEEGELHRFGELMHVHWEEKIRRKGTSDPQLNRWYEIGRENGAVGGKLIGAGGGGFFLFYGEGDAKARLRQAMRDEGLREVPFRFDFGGTQVVTNFV